MSHVHITIAVLITTFFALANSQPPYIRARIHERGVGYASPNYLGYHDVIILRYWCPWGSCSSTCRGVQRRVCLCPRATSSASCRVGSIQTRTCGCNPVHGGWSGWSAWGPCPVTCNGFNQTRTRSCRRPPPSCCGRNCTGQSSQTKICNPQPCSPTSYDGAPFAEALMRVDHTATTRCHARPLTCLTAGVCPDKCVDFCFYHDRDFLIILDSSASILTSVYAEGSKEAEGEIRSCSHNLLTFDPTTGIKAKVDLAILATHLCGHIGCNLRVAAMHFSSNPHYEFGFDSHTTPAAVYNGIIGMGKENAGTRTNLAFDFARLTMFTTMNGHRPCAKKVALIVTDGKSYNGPAAIAAAQALKISGVELFAVFIGNPGSVDYDEIRDYVSDSVSLHVFSVATVAELGTLADYIESIHHKFCHCHCHCHCQNHCHCDNHCNH